MMQTAGPDWVTALICVIFVNNSSSYSSFLNHPPHFPNLLYDIDDFLHFILMHEKVTGVFQALSAE